MGVGTLGFLKGFSSTQLDSMDKREQAQREKDKLEMLERLRREGEEIAFNRAKDDRDAAVDDKLTQYDYANGTVTFFNGKNKELSKRPMTQAELDDYKNKQELAGLTLEGKRLDNENTRARTATEGLQQANYRSMIADRGREARQRSLDSAATEDVGDAARARELVAQYQDSVKAAIASGNISQNAIDSAAIAVVANSRTGDEARRNFVTFLARYQSGRSATDQKARTAAGGLSLGN